MFSNAQFFWDATQKGCFAVYQAVSVACLDPSCHHKSIVRVCSRHFFGCLQAVSAQSCNLDWQRIAYNQPKKLFWMAKNDQWGDLREKPDEFTG